MLFFLYTFILCLPIIASCLYAESIFIVINRIISALLIAIFIYLSGNLIKNKKLKVFFIVTFSLLISLIFIGEFYSFYLQGESFNERFIYHLRWDVIKTGALNYPLYFFCFFVLLLLNLVISLSVSTSERKISFSKKSYYSALITFSFSLVTISNPISNLTTELIKYYNSNSAENIVVLDNNSKNITANPGKNLVLIYLESLEKNYLDETIFPGLTPNINNLSKEGVFLDNFIQKQGSGFTMAGIFSSQCGLPLISSSMSGNDILHAQNYNTLCLGDILNKADYKNVYYGGADLNFAGKGNFFVNHGYDQVFGFKELKKRLNFFNSKTSSWGLFDHDLFDLALEKYQQLSKSKKPFNLTLLTLDTHHPKGHTDERCPVYFDAPNNSMLNAVHCSDYLLGNFINQLKKEANWDNTVVMVMSDHLAMRNIVQNKLKQKPRLLSGFILNSQLESGVYSEPMYHVDVASTLLDLMQVSHNYQFLMSHSLIDRLGQNNHPPTPLDSPEKLSQLKSYLKQLSEKTNICNSSINFVLKKNIPLLQFGKNQLLLTKKGHPRLDKNNIYLINADDSGNLYDIQYVSKQELSNKIFSQNYGFSLFVTKTKNLVGTDFEHLYENHEKDWVSFIGKATSTSGDNSRTYESNTIFASRFPQLKFKKKVCSSLVKEKPSNSHAKNVHTTLPKIAHAGGGFQGKTYTNSIEALNHNYNKKFRYFELDFSWTSDQNLVCIHDWNNAYKRSFGDERREVPSLEEFNILVQTKSKFTKCNLSSLIEWLNEHSDAFIITDIKKNNLKGLKLISKKYPQYIQQFIPQIYQPEEFKTAQKLGFKKIIWTLYRYSGDEESVINFAQKHSLYAVTMPINRAKSGLALKLKNLGINSYAHTINNQKQLDELVSNYGITNIYTDFIPPQ